MILKGGHLMKRARTKNISMCLSM